MHGQLLDYQRGRYRVLHLSFVRAGGGACRPALALPSNRCRFNWIGDPVPSLPQRGLALLLRSRSARRDLWLETSAIVPCLHAFGDVRYPRRRFGRDRFLREFVRSS